MRPYILAETNWKILKDQEVELAVLPWGATEAHNYHLPYATDVIEGDEIGAEAGRKAWEKGAKVIVMPTIPFGVNTGQTDIKLDVNIYPSTQLVILNDIVEMLDRQGIKKLLILNSHGGNDFKTMLRELGVRYPKMFLSQCNWFRAIDRKEFFEMEGDHGEEMETSLLMYLRPELVRPLSEAGDGAERKSRITGIREGWAWSERQWSKVTKDTGIGDPSKASADKGKKYFEAVTDKVGELMVEIANLDRDNLYS